MSRFSCNRGDFSFASVCVSVLLLWAFCKVASMIRENMAHPVLEPVGSGMATGLIGGILLGEVFGDSYPVSEGIAADT